MLRGLEFHQLMQSVEKLGLQLIKLAKKAKSSIIYRFYHSFYPNGEENWERLSLMYVLYGLARTCELHNQEYKFTRESRGKSRILLMGVLKQVKNKMRALAGAKFLRHASLGLMRKRKFLAS